MVDSAVVGWFVDTEREREEKEVGNAMLGIGEEKRMDDRLPQGNKLTELLVLAETETDMYRGGHQTS
jgi:hypothetical protein